MPTKEVYVNLAIGFLTADVTDTGTTLNLTSTVGFPAAGNYMVKVDFELMQVTAATVATPGTLTVVRAQEGTTGAAHTQGSPVVTPVTDGSLRRLARQTKNGTSVAARREVNFIEGANVTLTLADDATNDKCDVTIAAAGGQTFESAFTVPVLTDYTWVNQGTATATDDGKGIFLKAPAASQNNVRGLFISSGSAPWSYVARLAPCLVPAASANCGLAVRDSVSGKITVLRFVAGSLNSIDFTNATSYAAGPSAGNTFDPSSVRWMKVQDDSTNRIWSISSDGLNWITYYTTTRTAFLTADQVGFFVEGGTSGLDAALKVASAKLN